MKIIAAKVFQLKQLKRRNLEKNSGLNGNRTMNHEPWVRFPFKPEYFQVSSFQLLKVHMTDTFLFA